MLLGCMNQSDMDNIGQVVMNLEAEFVTGADRIHQVVPGYRVRSAKDINI
jgi:hypothetical protein